MSIDSQDQIRVRVRARLFEAWHSSLALLLVLCLSLLASLLWLGRGEGGGGWYDSVSGPVLVGGGLTAAFLLAELITSRGSAIQQTQLGLGGMDDFVGADLAGMNLSRRYLRNQDFGDARLSRVIGIGLDVSRSRFHEALLTQAEFRHANLEHCDLTSAHCYEARFDDADLHGADLRGASLHHASFRNADLRGAVLDGAAVHGADFTKAKFGFDEETGRTTSFLGSRYSATRWPGATPPEAVADDSGWEQPSTKLRIPRTNLRVRIVGRASFKFALIFVFLLGLPLVDFVRGFAATDPADTSVVASGSTPTPGAVVDPAGPSAVEPADAESLVVFIDGAGLVEIELKINEKLITFPSSLPTEVEVSTDNQGVFLTALGLGVGRCVVREPGSDAERRAAVAVDGSVTCKVE